ncbi:type II secretion system GspH family protein [Candidatus Gracilibacteria bacterium]|nr:type II secretion system GspH family protein [Candidatus Gracilibacteria bacterium]
MKKGFTLIELLIVIAIIGILAVAFLPSLLGAPAKGRDATRVEQVSKIQTFMISTALTNPAKLPRSSCISAKDTNVLNVSEFIKASLADFGGVFPSDPKTVDNTAGGGALPGCFGDYAGYGYLKFEGIKGYRAGVFAVVEGEDKANILCSGIAPTKVPVLTPGKVVGIDPANGVYGCYLALIQ